LIKRLLIKHKIESDSQALTYYEPVVRYKLSYGRELEHFSMKKAKVSLCERSMLLTNEKFLKMSVTLIEIYHRTLSDVHLFATVFDIKLL
jgi:hypothetical protein